jgi:transcriptional regulator with XRE-family HTH domain
VRRHGQNYDSFHQTRNVVDEVAARFGRYLRAARLNSNLSITEVSARTGITEAALTALEQGIITTADIKPKWLRDLARALAENVEDFNLLLGREIGGSRFNQEKRSFLFVPVKCFSKPIYAACSALLFGFILSAILFLSGFSSEPASTPEQGNSFINVRSEHRLNRVQAESDFERQLLIEPISYSQPRVCCIY